jgi:hypothetical protein
MSKEETVAPIILPTRNIEESDLVERIDAVCSTRERSSLSDDPSTNWRQNASKDEWFLSRLGLRIVDDKTITPDLLQKSPLFCLLLLAAVNPSRLEQFTSRVKLLFKNEQKSI